MDTNLETGRRATRILRTVGFRLHVDRDGALQVNPGDREFSEQYRRLIRTHKPAILAYLASEGPLTAMDHLDEPVAAMAGGAQR